MGALQGWEIPNMQFFTNVEGTGKGAHEDTKSCTMQANIMTILLDKLLVFSSATSSKTVTLWI